MESTLAKSVPHRDALQSCSGAVAPFASYSSEGGPVPSNFRDLRERIDDSVRVRRLGIDEQTIDVLDYVISEAQDRLSRLERR
jgi:hypothetical protein